MRNLLVARYPLVAILALGASLGCSKAEPEEKKATAWTCARAAVPSGEVVQCTTGAMVAYGDGDYTSGSETLPDDSTITYDCPAGSTSPECPPSDPPIGSSSDSEVIPPTDSTTPPSGSGDGSNPGSSEGSSETTSSSSGGSSSGAPTGEPPPSSPPAGDNSGSSTSGPSGNNECGYSEDLPYCGGDNGSSSSSSSSSSSGSSGSDCGKPSCPPGQDKKGEASSSSGSSGNGNGSSGNASSSGGSSSGATGTPPPSGKGKSWKCKKTKEGNKCQSVPECGPGTHPAPCGACVSDDAPSGSDCVPPSAGGCWVTGGGFIQAASTTPAAPADGNDNFGGNAKGMKDGSVNGHWNHVDHGTKSHALGRPEYLFCRHVDEPGPGQPGGKKGLTSNQVYFGGHARFRTNGDWADGYWFDVVAKDHGEPGSQPKASKNGGMVDTYHFTLRKIVDPQNLQSGTVVYETAGGLVGGNIQIHPANNGHPAPQSPLPQWVSLEP